MDSIERVSALLNGKVTRMGVPRIPTLYFDPNGEGVVEAFDQAMVYRWEMRETDMVIEKVPVRKDDDRIAGIEMGFEALMDEPDPLPARTTMQRPQRQRAAQNGWRRV
jgi:hypothetical protein